MKVNFWLILLHFMTLLYFIGFVTGIIGSILIFYIIYKEKSIRLFSRLLLIQQNLFDLCVIIHGGIYCFLRYTSTNHIWTENKYLCGYFVNIRFIFINGATFTLCFMSIERFIMVTWPTHFLSRSLKWQYNLVLFFITILISSIWVTIRITETNLKLPLCYYELTLINTIFELFYSSIFPSLILMSTGTKICFILWKSSQRSNQIRVANIGSSQARNGVKFHEFISKSAVKVILLSSFHFFICSIPYCILKITFQLNLFSNYDVLIPFISLSVVLKISNSSTRFFFTFLVVEDLC